MKAVCRAFALLFALTIILSAATLRPAAAVYTADEVKSLADGVLAYKETQKNASDAQDLINGYLTDSAGLSAEWYVLGLSQSGSYDFGSYEAALLRYIDSNEIYSATARQKYALTLICAKSSSRFISDTLNNSIGELGVMSYIYGLHLLNNGYHSDYHTPESVISVLLSLRTQDGGWAVMGSRFDTDVTAMALCALAPYYHRDPNVAEAIDGALLLLSSSQKEDGGYYGFGGENCESTAQVLTALSCIGINANTDARFIKNGSTVLDGMLNYRLPDGSFSHTKGGSTDENATVQAYYSLIAFYRMLGGRQSLYLIDVSNPSEVKPPSPEGSDSYTPSSQSGYSYYDDEEIVEHIENIIIYYEDGGSSVTEPPPQTQPPSSPPPTAVQQTQLPATPDEKSTPSDASTPQTATKSESDSSSGGYKLFVILAILTSALIVCFMLYAMKKRHIKNFIFTGAVAAALILFVLLTDFSSKESYTKTQNKEDPAGTVTLSIVCDTVTDKDNEYIPENGVILPKTDFDFSDGETVCDILIEASKTYGIPLDLSAGSGYVRALNHIYEFDYGELSGWMYRVNGDTPSVGCDQYTLSDGDRIEWLYTTNMGEDLIN